MREVVHRTDTDVQDLVGYDPLQAGVLLPQGLQLLHLVDLHCTVLMLPAVEGRFADVHLAGDGLGRLSASIRRRIATICSGVCFFPFGIWVPFLEPRLSFAMAQFWYVRSERPTGAGGVK